MNTLYVKYERIDFFGKKRYTEDKIELPSIEHIKKAFRFLGTNSSVAVETVEEYSTVYYWDSLSDFEIKQITAKVFKSNGSYDIYNVPFNKLKKEIYKSI